jgi:hypothetical protein
LSPSFTTFLGNLKAKLRGVGGKTTPPPRLKQKIKREKKNKTSPQSINKTKSHKRLINKKKYFEETQYEQT